MIGGGIPGIENVGGDLDAVTGKLHLHVFSLALGRRWVWRNFSGHDPDQKFRFERSPFRNT